MAKIIDIDDHGQPLEDIKFRLKINKDQAEEIMSYNQLTDYIQKGTDAEEDPDSLFKFRDIVAHQGPLESTDPSHKESKYNVMVEWESGEVTYEPLTLISKDDPITCAVYAKKNDLLDTTGWKHLKRYAKTSKRLIRAVKQSRIRQIRASARYLHGFQVPRDYNDAIRLDKENSNTHWQDAMDLELTQIHEYKVFKDTGKAQFHNGKVVTPDGFQKIRVHFVYAVKHDGRFKEDLFQMDISPKNLLNPSILEWFPLGASEWLFSYPSSTIWKSVEQMLEMHILKPTLMKSYASLLDQNSRNYKAIS